MMSESTTQQRTRTRYPDDVLPRTQPHTDTRAVLVHNGAAEPFTAIRVLNTSEFDYDLATVTYLIDRIGVSR